MSYLWYLLWVGASCVWVCMDVRARNANRYWIAAVAVAGPIAVAAYLAFRPLNAGELREGGRAWQFLSKLVVSWTALLAWAALCNLVVPFAGMTTIATVWAFVSVPALAVGLAVKRGTTECGPTVAFGDMALGFAACERTADGRAYICRECGKEYSVELPFCDGCGAWPGDSG